MKRDEMVDHLMSLDTADMLPAWVISYQRAGTAPLLERVKSWDHPEKVHVLVRETQRAAYEEAYPTLSVHSLPDEQINNVGRARKAAQQLAYMESDVALLIDDDILEMNFLFERLVTRGPNVGRPCSGHSLRGDHRTLQGLEERILTAISLVAADVFEENPRAVLGGAIKQHMSFDVKNHMTKYIINGGVTPRQVMVHHLARMEEFGIELNTELFGCHGDDIGTAAEVLKAGADCFAIPSFIYDSWPENVNIKESVIRDAETAPALHEWEWDALQQYPIKDYLRVKRSIVDDSYEWGDVNWSKLNKLRKTAPKRVLWDGAPEGLLDLI